MNAPRDSSPVDRDGVQGGVVLLVALATVLVIGLGVIVTHELQTWHVGAEDLREAPARFGRPPADMNAIEMSLLAPRALASPGQTQREGAEHDRTAAARQAAAPGAAQRLQSYGWSERERGTVHIPISRAVELYLAREHTERVGPGERAERVGPGEKQEPGPSEPPQRREPAPGGGAPRSTP